MVEISVATVVIESFVPRSFQRAASMRMLDGPRGSSATLDAALPAQDIVGAAHYRS